MRIKERLPQDEKQTIYSLWNYNSYPDCRTFTPRHFTPGQLPPGGPWEFSPGHFPPGVGHFHPYFYE